MAQIKDFSKTGYYYSPPRKLIRSAGSSAAKGGTFHSEDADIPDNFATNESPKLKFLFSVQFYPRDLDLYETGDIDMDKMAFALKRATRPNITGTYQPVNYYNFRTQVLTKIEYGSSPATLTFYDDSANRALDVLITYLNTVSPISNKKIEQADSLGSDSSSSTVAAMVNKLGPLKAIRVAHHSIDYADANKMQSVYYDYLNPKIISMTLDELDMSASDVTTVELSFVYDSVKITNSGTDLNGTGTVGPVQRFGK